MIPSDLVERFCAGRRSVDLCPSQANQGVLAQFIRQGDFARHLRKMRRTYAERRRVLVDAITNEFGSSCEIVGAEACMHLTIVVGTAVRDTKIAAHAAERKLWLSSLSLSYTGDFPRTGFVLGFGNAPTAQIPTVARLLKSLLRVSGTQNSAA